MVQSKRRTPEEIRAYALSRIPVTRFASEEEAYQAALRLIAADKRKCPSVWLAENQQYAVVELQNVEFAQKLGYTERIPFFKIRL